MTDFIDENGPVGAALQRIREERGLTREDVSRALKLHVRQLEAIESDDFRNLGGTVFVRGFVRNYARFLQLDADAVMRALDHQISLPQTELRVPENVNVTMPRTEGSRPLLWVGALLPLLLVLLVAMAYQKGWISGEWLGADAGSGSSAGQEQNAVAAPLLPPVVEGAPAAPASGPAGTEAAPGSAAPSGTEGAPAGSAPAAPQGAAPGSAAPVAATPAAASLASVEIPKPQAAAAAPGRVVMEFGGDSWVEVRDGTGKSLMSRLNRAGAVESVDGTAPFRLVIGNAASVRLRYDGRPVDLAPHVRGDVARVTLE